MNAFLRYWQGGKRRLQAWRYQRVFRHSVKPLADMDKTYVTLFFDYEGEWSYVDHDQDKCSRKGIEYILNTLDKASLRATFNCVGKLIEDHRDMLERIAQAGHEIASHTVEHTTVDRWSVAQMDEDIEHFRNLLAPIATMVLGFRAPQSRWSSNTLRGLLQSGVIWDAEADLSPFPYVIAQSGNHKLWRMPVAIDDWKFERRSFSPSVMQEVWRKAIMSAIEQRRYVSVGFHPWVLGKDNSRLEAFSQFIGFLSSRDDLEIATFGDIAQLCENRITVDDPK